MESLSEFHNLYMLADTATSVLENRAAFPCLRKEEEEEDEIECRTSKREIEKDYNKPYKRTKKPGPPGWIEAHIRMMGFNRNRSVCSFTKRLANTDVKHNFNSPLIPKEVGHNGLIPELGYRAEDADKEGVMRAGVEVVGLDRMGREWKLQWKWWNSIKAHILIGQWIKLVRDNGLKANVHTIKVSVFSYGEQNNRKICFLILHSDLEEQE